MSPRISVTRLLKFDAGHRLMNHEGKCKTVHGHEYRAEITCSSEKLDRLGRVVDFSVIKERVGGWIDTYLDHTCIFNHYDDNPAVLAVIAGNESLGRPCMVIPGNPTAENIAVLLLKEATRLLADKEIRVDKVKLWETQNAYAEVLREDS